MNQNSVFVLLFISPAFFVWPIARVIYNKILRMHTGISQKQGKSTALTFLFCFVISVWCMRFAVGYYCIASKNTELLTYGDHPLTLLEEGFNSAVHALQTFSMDEDYTAYLLDGKRMIEELCGKESRWVQVYGLYASLQNMAAPILGGAILLDMLASFYPKAKLRAYCYVFLWKKKIYFSELNEASLALAKDLCRPRKKTAIGRLFINNPLIVFTDVYVDNETDEKKAEMLLEAKRLGAICLHDDPVHVTKPRHGKREYYLMDEKEADNLQALSGLTESRNLPYVRNSVIYYFVQSDSYVQIEKQIHESFNDEKKKKLLKGGRKPVMIAVNSYRNLVQNLFGEVPLYEPLIGQSSEKLTVTIFGNGQIGTEAFLNAYWLGQMLAAPSTAPCELAFHIVSKDDEATFWSKIDYINPEIRSTATPNSPLLAWNNTNDGSAENPPYCSIEYTQADVKKGGALNSPDMADILKSNYYIVALGSDSDNIAIAEKLRSLVGEKHIKHEIEGKAVITYAVFDPELSKTLNRKKKFFVKNGADTADIYMHAFGNIDQVYCCDNVYMSENTVWAEQIGGAYSNTQKVGVNTDAEDTDKDLNYKYWANLARAEHIRYKNFSLGWFASSVFDKNMSDEERRHVDESLRSVYKKLLVLERSKLSEKQKAMLLSEKEKEKLNEIQAKKEYLAWLEHRRWCAFTRTMGYRTVDADCVLNAVKANKDTRLKLHTCLVEAFEPRNAGETYTPPVGEHGVELRDRLDKVTEKVQAYRSKPFSNIYKVHDYPVFEFDYEFESVLSDELKACGFPQSERYCDHTRLSDSVEFGNESFAVAISDVVDALKEDYTLDYGTEPFGYKYCFRDKTFVLPNKEK